MLSVLFLIFLVVQRLSELVIAKRNTAALMAKGAVEYGAEHYPIMVAMHSTWIVCLIWFGYDQPVAVGWLAVFGFLQIFRLWILTSLGPRWTTRIIVLSEPLVVKGPFKFMNHPNYALVVAEIFVAPMVLGLTWVAILFSIANAAMLYVRISLENKALAPLRVE